MCMLTVEKCEVIPETWAWKAFNKYNGHLHPTYMVGHVYPENKWLQADPNPYPPRDGEILPEWKYVTGFHTYEKESGAALWLRNRSTTVVRKVLIRGIAYRGEQDQEYNNETGYVDHFYGWTAQEMYIPRDGEIIEVA